MGIRKHFEKKPDELKLQDLSLETEEPKALVFNPEEEIIEQDWERILQRLKEYHDKGWWGQFARLAHNFKIIFPDKSNFFLLDQQALKGIKEQKNTFQTHYHMMILKNLFPDQINFGQEDFEKLKQELKFNKSTDLELYVTTAFSLQTLFPKESKELDLKNNEIIDKIKRALFNKKDHHGRYCRFAAKIRLFSPELFEELGLTEKDFENKKEEMNRAKLIDWIQYSYDALTLSILTAKRIEFTNQGYKLVMSELDLKQPKKPRPERKNF